MLTLLSTLKCCHLFASVEYEVDELRRDIELCKRALPLGVQINLVHSRNVVQPGIIFAASSGKAYAVGPFVED